MLVRKIDRAKWMCGDDVKDPACADAITNCLKTKRNTLSVWHINNESELEEAVLAIVSGQDHLASIDVVVMDDEYIVKCEIPAEETEGLTPVEDLKKTHRDLTSLDFWTVGMVAEHIIESIKKGKIKRFTEGSLKTIIKEAIDKNRLDLSELKDAVREKIAIQP